jgi:hemolysin activation/secretion protein
MPHNLVRHVCSVRFICSSIILSAVAAGLLDIPGVHAQQTPDLSIIDRRVKQGEKTAPRKVPPPAPDIQEAAPGAPSAPALEPFTLSGVIIEGATVFEPSALTATYEQYLATRIGDAEVEEILRRITQRYHADGYFLSRAVAPAQDITAGLLRVRVIEGHVVKFSPVGNYPHPEVLERYARPVLGERPARLETVERALLLISDLAGVTVKPNLKPLREDVGEYELIAEVEYRPVQAFARLDNRGTPDVGRLQGWLGAGLNGVLGFGESIYANFVTVPDEPRELLHGSLSGTLPLGGAGTYVALYGAHGDIDAGARSAALDSDSTSTQVVGRVGHPLIRARAQSLWISGTFDYRDFHQSEFDETVTDDKLRVLRAGLSYALTDAFKGESQAGIEVSQGLDVLDASSAGSDTLSRSDGRSRFTKIAGNAARLQKFTDRISVRLGLVGQWSADPLLAYEEFSLGGEYFGRAYDYGERSGEHGIAASGEVRYGSETKWRWLSEYQLYGFYDVGAAWNKTSGDGLTRDHLSSAGAGFRLRLNDALRTSFEAAKPLDERVATTGDRDWRFFFTIVGSY